MDNSIPVVNSTVTQQKEKLDSVTLVQPGFHPARCYSVVDLGHQYSSKFNKWSPKIEYVFEILDHRQLFYPDDTEVRPSVCSIMHTNSMGSTSNLRKFVKSAFGKAQTDEEAQNFNIYSFADKVFMVNISHSNPDKDGNIYENIDSIAPFNPAMYNNVDLSPHNELLCFHIGTHGFNSPNFAFLPGFKRNLIMKSQEAMEHQKTGGKFAERSEFETEGNSAAQGPAGSRPQQGQTQPANNPQNGPQQGQADIHRPKVIMLVDDYSYEDYIKSGWTDASLVKTGYAKWAQQAAPAGPGAPPTGPSAPAGPSSPGLNIQGDMPTGDISNLQM